MTQNNESQIRTWGMLTHLSSLIWIPLMFIGLSFPVLNILGPLGVWLAKRNDDAFIDDQGKESLNFQISFTIYYTVLAFILAIVGTVFAIVVVGNNRNNPDAGSSLGFLSFAGLGILFLIVAAIAQLILVIIASMKAKNGEFYRYPLTIRFLR